MNVISATARPGHHVGRSKALRFVVFVGVVSMLADMTYEGARGITGPFLAVLGASGAAVGIVAGFGELVGYALRLLSGYIADRSGRYWLLTFVGYAVNLLAVPLLALAGNWQAAAVLIVLERAGKALRTPARDAMLSHATSVTGHGWGFGLHEALDQIGAVLGPLAVAAVLYFREGYQTAFAALLVPALLALTVLAAARIQYPRPRDLERLAPALEPRGLRGAYWLYLAGVGLLAAGYADFPLIAYHFEKTGTVSDQWIPLFYATAMGVDGLAALAFGYLLDRRGIAVLALSTALAAPFAPLAFLGGFTAALGGAVLWGIGMGAQESVLRAAVARMAPSNRRTTAYGILNLNFGVCWFLGSALMGRLYDVSIAALVAFSVATQLAAAVVFLFAVPPSATHR
jgi:MFS family permease